MAFNTNIQISSTRLPASSYIAAGNVIDGINLFSAYKLFITKWDDINATSRLKLNTREFADADGIDVDFEQYYQEKREITVEGIVKGSSKNDAVRYYNAFISDMRKPGLRLIYNSEIDTVYPVIFHEYINMAIYGNVVRFKTKVLLPYPVFIKIATQATTSLNYSAFSGVIFWGDFTYTKVNGTGTIKHTYNGARSKYCVIIGSGDWISDVSVWAPLLFGKADYEEDRLLTFAATNTGVHYFETILIDKGVLQ